MSKRPGGLTALAVLNFVFGGLGLLFSLLYLVGITLLVETMKANPETFPDPPGAGILYFGALLGLLSVSLMIASGVGYLKQKKFLGRTLGNSYAALSLASTVLSLTMMEGSFGIATILGLIYPVLTLALLNTTFKDDFIN